MKNKPQRELPPVEGESPEVDATAPPVPAINEPAEVPVPAVVTSATGLPIDQFHGRGGTYILRNGVRELVE